MALVRCDQSRARRRHASSGTRQRRVSNSNHPQGDNNDRPGPTLPIVVTHLEKRAREGRLRSFDYRLTY
ncbi:hypothetical protein AHF37_03480 [Paragonimus kellicotti]|nr:hypothetical protein AHF37_03480 [Paragonimus kellicotti]